MPTDQHDAVAQHLTLAAQMLDGHKAELTDPAAATRAITAADRLKAARKALLAAISAQRQADSDAL